CDHQNAALSQLVVSFVDAVHKKAADARPRKNSLGYDGSGQQNSKLKPEHGDHRYQSVLEYVFVDHLTLGQALCPRGSDVVFSEFFEYARAYDSSQNSRESRAESDRRQDQMREAPRTRDRCDSQLNREYKDQQRTKRKARQRDPKQRPKRRKGIYRAALVRCSRHSQRD